MDNYEGALDTEGARPVEDGLTASVEKYTARLSSSTYLGIAVGAMVLSLAFEIAGRGTWGGFIARWAPTWLIAGVCNKVARLEDYRRAAQQGNRGYSS